MSSITLEIPEELAAQLRPVERELPRILELGLRELHATSQLGFEGAAEVLEFLAGLPSPEAIIALRPSEALQERISTLLEKNRNAGLTASESEEWEQYQYLEHLVRLAKAKAYHKLHEQ
jgi:hypothetical protein